MKICIELDEWMKKEWDNVKRTLEASIKFTYGVDISHPDEDVFVGLLFCFNDEGASNYFPEWLYDEEV